jgi:hypothetical protein
LRPEIGLLHRQKPGTEAGRQGVLRGQSVCPPHHTCFVCK